MIHAGNLLRPDVCVIGGGSAGLSVAAAVAAFGVSVVLIERYRMGGECLHYGCVPSKSLIAASHYAQAVRLSKSFGVESGVPAIDIKRVHAHVDDIIAAIAPNDSAERFSKLGVEIIAGLARFIDARTVLAGGRTIRARRFVVATGSSPLMPAIPGLSTTPFLTNNTIFDRDAGIDHLLVMGGGPAGMELAQAWRRLGSKVTLVTSGRVVPREDQEQAAVLADCLRNEGVAIEENSEVIAVEALQSGGVVLRVRSEQGERDISGTHLLITVGRSPNTDALDLQNACVSFNEMGITVSASMRTTNRRIYAVGDVVAGAPRFTHVANYAAGLVARNILFRIPARMNRTILPQVTFTTPELASVGLGEAEAKRLGKSFRVVHLPFSENDRAQTERDTVGNIKVLAGRRGKILGVSIVGTGASDMIGLWSFAMARNSKLWAVASYVAPYPTRGEIGKRVAVAYFASAAVNPWLRRIVRFLRLFG